MNLNQTFRAFRNHNYQLYFWGRTVSQFGTALQRMAVVWMIYSITNAASMIGIAFFAEQFPSFIFSIFGGIAADRYNRYKIVNITQIASMIQSSVLAALVITGHKVVWEILTLSVVLGIINAFDVPARQAMMNDVVEKKEDLSNALSLNSAMASLSKLAGPIAAGLILQHLGAGICFVLNALSFAGVMVSLYLMKDLPAYVPNPVRKKIKNDLADGFAYLWKVPAIGFIIIALIFECFLVMPYDTLLPVYAKEVFHGNASTYGYITGFVAAGAIVATIWLASLKSEADALRKYLFGGMFVLSIGLMAFSYNSNMYLAVVFAAMCGFGTAIQNTVTNVIVQSEADPDMRGRAISIMLMVMFGVVPLGSLMIGFLSEKTGARNAILYQGMAGLCVACLFLLFIRKRNPNK